MDIYSYTTGHQYLLEVWREKKAKNKSFSLRAWAKNLGFKSHAPLQLMLAGKRSIPKRWVPLFIDSLSLGPREGLYLESLLELDFQRDPRKIDFCLKRLKELSPKPLVRFHEIEQFTFLRDPLHAVLVEMVDLKGFTPEPKKILKRLRFASTERQVAEALERIIALGLVREDANGKLTRTHLHLSSKHDVADRAVQEYHQRVSLTAADAVTTQSVEDREFGGYGLNIKKSALPVAKSMMRSFVKQFMETVEAKPGYGEETYQLNVQFFSMSKSEKEVSI